MSFEDKIIIDRSKLTDFDDFTSDLTDMKSGKFSKVFSDYCSFDGDIISYLDKIFKAYISEVDKLNSLDYANECFKALVQDFRIKSGIKEDTPAFDVLRDIKNVCNMILDCLIQYFKGFSSDAYCEMEKIMTDKQCHLLNLLPQVYYDKGGMTLFRVIKGNKTDVKDLFHVPYDKRELCDSYRYSILGVPALYCSASLETALLETGITLGQDYSAAIFSYKPDEKVALIDLTMTGRRDYGFWERYSLIIFFPLIVACGLDVRKPGKPFRPEYIIPQMFYQLIRQHGNNFKGIIFSSTKYPVRDITDASHSNYVLFTSQCDQEQGYCQDLANSLTIRGPRSIEYKDHLSFQTASHILRHLSTNSFDII